MMRRFSAGSVTVGCSLALLLSGCAGSQRAKLPVVDPDVARAQIAALLPAKTSSRDAWAIDMFAALEALRLPPTTENICAVIAVTEQESTFQVNPPVPGLPTIARREIDTRAARYNIPKLVVRTALELQSPTGDSYRERLEKIRTEKGLSDLFDDFIGIVPLGGRLFADLNPVRTGGPMQVSIAYAEAHARSNRYPYSQAGSIRDEIFTRRGGMYFGIAHLLHYEAPYDAMLFRFADFNAGHYASRNVAFQKAVSSLSRTNLALDGDLLRHGSSASEPSNTELATRKIASRIELSDGQIRRDLEHGDDLDFDRSTLYERVFKLADATAGRPVPRAMLPVILLKSPKITRQLTTQWFANRVDERYRKCLARAPRHQTQDK